MGGTSRIFLIVIGVALAGEEPCRTPEGTLCRTIRWETTGWENVSWGFHAIARWTGTTTLAYGRDGRSYERYASRSFRNYVIDEGQSDRAMIGPPWPERTVEIDHVEKTYRLSGVHGRPIWGSDDPDCAKMSRNFLLTDLRRGGEAIIAGVRAIEYTGRRSASEAHTYWLAPSLGCTQMKVLVSRHNSLGLPTFSSREEVTLVQMGEPEPALFQVPPNYRPVR